MKANKRVSSILLAAVAVTISLLHPAQLPAQSTKTKSGEGKSSPQWSLQVDKVDPGDVTLAPSFQIAIYENLLDELNKTKRFKRVLRDGAWAHQPREVA